MSSLEQKPTLSAEITLHARTLRAAREQVKAMMQDGFSTPKIKAYLCRWASWWSRISEIGGHQKILPLFFEYCWDIQISMIALEVMQQVHVTTLNPLHGAGRNLASQAAA